MRPIALFTLCFLTASSLCAQKPSPWQGEWSPLDASGDRLTLGDCTAQSCKFYLAHKGCSTLTNSPLSVQSDTEATANLPGEDATHSCQLHLQRSASNKPTIAVKQSGNGCSYYCISGYGSFETTFVQHSSVVYAGRHAAECLKTTTPAPMATCLDLTLAGLEQQWQDLYSDFPLTPPNKDTTAYQASEELDDAILGECDKATDPAQCLQSRFTSDIAVMNAKKAAFIAGYTERGDPAEGGRIARSIAGRYRHTFDNGDVQGDSYRTTDKLTITPVGTASIHFDAYLNFYNGHTCSLSGGALYRKDGSFVFDDDPANAPSPTGPVCKLAILPDSKGVEFKDLTGGCKDYCGARGSWNGETFSFGDRVPPRAATKQPPK